MWCAICQQDVPVGGSDGKCLKCGTTSRITPNREQPGRETIYLANSVPDSDPPALPLGDWELSDQLDRIERALARKLPEVEAARNRFDPPHLDLSDLALATGPGSPEPAPPATRMPAGGPLPRGPITGWFAVAMGLLSITFTIGLLALHSLGATGVPTNLALPFLLTGQVALIVGWCLMAARWWRAAQVISGQVEQLAERIGSLEESTERMACSVTGSSSGFYSRMAQGASPHLLLAEIKGQLDQLAMRMIANPRE